MIRVMVVEDHPLLIQGLRRVLENEPDLDIVAEATTGEDAVRLAIELTPDVILMDINLRGKNGLQATHEIKQTYAIDETAIIILTAYNEDEQLMHALRSGASAYYPKDVLPSELIPAIRTVAQDHYLVHDKVLTKAEAYRWLLLEMGKLTIVPETTADAFAPLSPREMEVLTLTTRGASNKEIASSLNISRQTVKNHMSSVLRKLGVEDRTQAAVLALRRGWVRMDDSQAL
ncbi:MAG: response regulator transcription factor [Caldilineaceae bacterium]|nr:response regulator transcription factor [Caldilineaceae bacterium]